MDYKERAAKDEEKRKLQAKLNMCVVQDRKKFDLAWAGYQKHAEVDYSTQALSGTCVFVSHLIQMIPLLNHIPRQPATPTPRPRSTPASPRSTRDQPAAAAH